MTAVALGAGLLAMLAAGDAIARALAGAAGTTSAAPAASPSPSPSTSPSTSTLPARLARAFLLGAGTHALALLVLLRAGAALTVSVLALDLLSAAAYLAAPRVKTPRSALPATRAGRVFALLLVLELAQTAAAALIPPLTAWDSWVTWWSKAAGIAADEGLTANLLANPDRLATNLSYPLLLPLTEASLLALAPGAGERVAGVVALAFHAALLAILWSTLRRRLGETPALGFTVLFAATPRVFRFAPLGMADLPLAGFVLLAFGLLLDLDAKPAARELALLGLAGGFLPFTKDEGWIWLGLLALALLARRGARALAVALPVALAAGLAWPLARGGWAEHPYVFGREAHAERLLPVALGLARCLVRPDWSFVWPLAALSAFAALASRRALGADARLLLLVPAAFLLVSSGAFLYSRFDPWQAHLANSVDRLALQGFPLAVAGLALAFRTEPA